MLVYFFGERGTPEYPEKTALTFAPPLVPVAVTANPTTTGTPT